MQKLSCRNAFAMTVATSFAIAIGACADSLSPVPSDSDHGGSSPIDIGVSQSQLSSQLPLLSVSISGTSSLPLGSTGPATNTATVAGGNSQDYYYHWRRHWCRWYEENSYGEPGVECTGVYLPVAEGQGLSQISFNVHEHETEWLLAVQVRELPDGYTVGVDTFHAAGPGAYLYGIQHPDACDTFGSVYPHEEYIWVDGQGWDETGRNYRINPCTWAREFQPGQ